MDSNNQHLRCQSTNKQGIQCGFPKDHGNGMAIQTWEDQKPTAKLVINGTDIRIHEGNIKTTEFNGFNSHVDRRGTLNEIHTSGYVQEIKKK